MPSGKDEGRPEGERVLDTGALVACPHCGEAVEVVLDAGGGPVQRYVEDCPVCCRPWSVTVRYGPDGAADVRLEGEP